MFCKPGSYPSLPGKSTTFTIQCQYVATLELNMNMHINGNLVNATQKVTSSSKFL